MLTFRRSTKPQKGYTFIELLIGIGMIVFVLGNGVLMYYNLVKSLYESIKIARLDSQMNDAIDLMVKDIRRAGYSANAINDISSNTNTNPFMSAGNDLQVPVSTCILFTYDVNGSGAMPALHSANFDKRFGYRLSGITLQSRALTDATFACDQGNWVDLTDSSQVRITQVTFVYTPTVVTLANGVSTITIRSVSYTISGELVSDSSISRTYTGVIRVRNDVFTP